MKIPDKLKKNLIRAAVLSVFLIPFAASAQWTTGTPPGGLISADLKEVLSRVIVWILGFIGLLGIIFLVYGGIRYVTSAGNDSEMEEGKRTVMYAIFGLFLTASAYAIVKTVIGFVG